MIFDCLKGKKVLLTGNTGFKGSWMTLLLRKYGAVVYGYSIDCPTDPCLYELLGLCDDMQTEMGDVADYDRLYSYFCDIEPDIVIHMAAQPIVRTGYKNPRETYSSNVMGTVNILECIRNTDCTRSFLNVTTDKVYENLECDKYYSEGDRLDGFDPYSNSKSCSELVTHCYERSFFEKKNCSISTARAGNVIGGGDFADDRIVPDCVRAMISKKKIIVRNPNSIRPYQHVLEPLFAYTMIICKQMNDRDYSGSYNVGPNRDDCLTTGELATKFCNYWGDDAEWVSLSDNGPHEANYLKLDNTLLKETLGVSPMWTSDDAISHTVSWTRKWLAGDDVRKITEEQIDEYLKQRQLA